MQSSPVAVAPDSRGLVAVAVKTLQSLEDCPFDLYIWPAKQSPARLYREKHVPLLPADLERLLKQHVGTLYTRAADAEQYCEHVRSHVLADETKPASERYGILKDATRTVLMDSLDRGDVDGTLKISAGFSRDLVSLVCDRKDVLHELLSVMAHDYSTFTHITNVCTCAIMLAEAYDIRDHAELAEIAQGALLHDVGKCFVPAKILNKAGALTKDEQQVVRMHPVRGFEELSMRKDISWGQLMMVYQHHERYDGRGYPVGVVGKESHPWARLLRRGRCL